MLSDWLNSQNRRGEATGLVVTAPITCFTKIPTPGREASIEGFYTATQVPQPKSMDSSPPFATTPQPSTNDVLAAESKFVEVVPQLNDKP